jgi:ACS family glucarate transporter-like MFS transporter
MSALIAIQLLLGLGQGVPFPASARAVANWFPSGERGGATGLYLSGNRLGQAAIASIGPTLIVAFGWRFFFVIAGLAGLIWLAAWLFTFRSWRIGPTPHDGPNTETRLSLAESLPLLRNRQVLGIFLGFFAYDYAWFLLLRWLPVYLSMERHFDRHEMALANSIPYVLVVFLVIPAGMGADLFVRRGWNEIRVRKSFISLGLLLGSLMVPATLVQSKAACSWLLAAAVCGLGCAAPNAWLLTQAVCPKQLVGTASGIQNFGGNVAGILVPAITGFIAHRTGQSIWAFGLAGLILLCGIASYWFLIPDTSSVDSIARGRQPEAA